MDFEPRYKTLNDRQREAVDTIDGPVMVIAGPGTGKTELLSMRAANILRQTDELPSNILCLTFTESGAAAMRERLAGIIGADAYKVAIHTFHGFGTEIISRNREYFYRGATFEAASELQQLEIIQSIFDELDHTNILSSKINGDYTYLADTLRSISELKRSGLTSDELLKILEAGDHVCDAFETEFADIFATRINKASLPQLTAMAQKTAEFISEPLPLGLTPLANVLALSLAHACDEADVSDSTKPLTAWKNQWFEKNQNGRTVFKNRKRHAKLRSLAFVYYRYITALETAGLYDFDDMILEVIHAIETNPELKYNLQETYHYLMVDEFQDTNLAQLRLLLNLVDNPVSEGQPNLMVVGDDDQAIYSFQGADISNIMQLQQLFPSTHRVTLTDNYRSTPEILASSRDVIKQGTDRLEQRDKTLDKTLTPHIKSTKSVPVLSEFVSSAEEYHALASDIAARIKRGTVPDSIAVIARKHAELESIVPYLAHHGILVNYERQHNIFDLDIIRHLELLARLVSELHRGHLDHAAEFLPEFLSHPAWDISTKSLWQLSLNSYHEKRSWFELMAERDDLATLHAWLLETARLVDELPLTAMLDRLIGDSADDVFVSPLKAYFFSKERLVDDPESYLTFLGALTEIRDQLSRYTHGRPAKLDDFLDFIDLYHSFDRPLMSTRAASRELDGAINLMTAHKSKGLEFDTVYIVGLDEKTWGTGARSGFSKISYPENLPLRAHTGSVDEQLRLLFVAMTRARQELHLSYSSDQIGAKKPRLVSEFLLIDSLDRATPQQAPTLDEAIKLAEVNWRAPLIQLPPTDQKTMLTPLLERLKLSSSSVNDFVDVVYCGPAEFLLRKLLHFPSTSAPEAAFGIAIHAALQSAQTHLLATENQRPLEDTLNDFDTALGSQSLTEPDLKRLGKRGVDSLQVFLGSNHNPISKQGKPELDFRGQDVRLNDVRLTGTLDLAIVDSAAKTIRVIDYKTGKPLTSWQGRTPGEKIKLHKYRQQLMFYRLLVEQSPLYSGYTWQGSAVQCVEPNEAGDIVPPLEADFNDDEYQHFQQLVHAIWQAIMALDFETPDHIGADYAAMVAFEATLIDKYT